MPLKEVAKQLDDFRALLREGRVNEVDVQLLDLRKTLDHELEEQKKLEPPPEPKQQNELLMAALEEISDSLGNKPRLRAILVELKPKLWPEEVPPAPAPEE